MGVVLPGLPTTPFLLLASALFLRSSDRLYNRLVNSRVLGRSVRRYHEQGGMSLRAKIVSITLMWSMIVASLGVLATAAARVTVAAVGAVGTVVMGWVVRTAKGGAADPEGAIEPGIAAEARGRDERTPVKAAAAARGRRDSTKPPRGAAG